MSELKACFEKAGFRNIATYINSGNVLSRTRWSKVVGTKAYQDITIRNANTAKKLLELAFTK